MSNLKIGSIITAAVILLLGVITFFSSFNVIDVTEFGYRYDRISGQMEGIWEVDKNGNSVLDTNGNKIPRVGFVWKLPFVESIHTFDVLPIRTCLGEANTRVLNCKLIQFEPSGWRTFIMWHGRGSYSHGISSKSLNEILLTYAFSDNPEQYDFLNTIDDTQLDKEITLQ